MHSVVASWVSSVIVSVLETLGLPCFDKKRLLLPVAREASRCN